MKKIVIISGPTAVGKTNISIKLAKAINGEIISADSMQVYKGLDIGSAKISVNEMDGIKHHLIDVLDPKEKFDVTIFQKLATKAIDEITSQGKIPIIVGGTAFYIQALLYGIDFTEENHDFSYREALDEESEDDLYEKLLLIDPEYALSTHKNNKKRVIRALEYHHFTGKKFSEYNAEQAQKEAIYNFNYFVLDDIRELIYENINKRVEIMFNNGLLDEVIQLKNLGLTSTDNSMQGIGYKEVLSYLNNECSIEDAKELIKKNTRHFAKRQLIWLRKEPDTIFINKSDYNHDDNLILDYMLKRINENDSNV